MGVLWLHEAAAALGVTPDAFYLPPSKHTRPRGKGRPEVRAIVDRDLPSALIDGKRPKRDRRTR